MKKVNQTGIENFTEDIAGGLTMEIRVETTEYGRQFSASVKKELEDGRRRQIVSLSQEIDGQILMSVVKESGLTEEQLRDVFAKSAEVVIEVNI